MKRNRKTKPAIWMEAFPKQREKRISSANEKTAYRREAVEFVRQANERKESCPVILKLQQIAEPVECVHHIRGRGRGGRGPLLRDQRYWMAVSRRGHDWIHRNIEAARAEGWICEKGLWNTP